MNKGHDQQPTPACGLVVIGRNEGERLRACLESVEALQCPVVYVDSDSTDNSIQVASEMGIPHVHLETATGLSAAKARNAGARWLAKHHPEITFIQFVDGDCVVQASWIDRALRSMEDEKLFAVCGRCREQHPNSSIYNRLCDLEWDGPIGEIASTGGNVMVRRAPFDQIGGFDPLMVAGEEPDLCFRLKSLGGRIRRIDAEMVTHDADMHHFRQWIRRCVRSGYADAAGHYKHRGRPGRYRQRQLLSTLLWAAVIPFLVVFLGLFTAGLAVVILVLYPLLGARIYYRSRQAGRDNRTAMLYAVACLGSKFPAFWGVITFYWQRLMGRQPQLIEHKSSANSTSSSERAA